MTLKFLSNRERPATTVRGMTQFIPEAVITYSVCFLLVPLKRLNNFLPHSKSYQNACMLQERRGGGNNFLHQSCHLFAKAAYTSVSAFSPSGNCTIMREKTYVFISVATCCKISRHCVIRISEFFTIFKYNGIIIILRFNYVYL